ncbi:MAG TPA: CoA ester lyase [Burkholderiales bacterium]|nr:CoA ester lyase [Burkholderiales bacterium]
MRDPEIQPIGRSYLFVPGNRPERFAKACGAGADAVIVDLEDAVPAAEKAGARAALAAWLSPAQPVLVRINGAETEWFRDDLELCKTPGVAVIVLPKAEGIDHLKSIEEQVGRGTLILPLIETARGLWNALELAQARNVRRLVFGSIDFQLDLAMQADEDELLCFRSQLVLASRVAGIDAPVDGVSTALDDPEQLRADTLRARRLGFGGKLCIHPKQVAHVNECFRPGADEVAWAKRVLDAASAAKGAAVAVDGKMVDRPVILKAQAILSEAER